MEVHHIAFRSHHLERTVAFYRDAIGLRIIRETPNRSTWFQLSHAVLMVEQAESSEPIVAFATSHELLAFRVDENTRRELCNRLHDYGCKEEAHTECTSYFRDPDGRKIGLSSYPMPAPVFV